MFDTPSRAYDQNVGQEYDAWTEEGVLEYYWGEHIHLGYYTEEVRTGAQGAHSSLRKATREQTGVRQASLLGRVDRSPVAGAAAVIVAGTYAGPASLSCWLLLLACRSGKRATRRRTSSR